MGTLVMNNPLTRNQMPHIELVNVRNITDAKIKLKD